MAGMLTKCGLINCGTTKLNMGFWNKTKDIDTKTIIHSNGSKWAGQEPDGIDKLVEVLGKHAIEKRFFGPFTVEERKGEEVVDVTHYFCPIKQNGDDTRFFGNFEDLSHVFRIDTNDPEVIDKLTMAIKSNEGWKKYIHLNEGNEN